MRKKSNYCLPTECSYCAKTLNKIKTARSEMEKSEKVAVGSDGSRLGCVLHSVWWKKQENVVRFKLMRVECVSFTNCILCLFLNGNPNSFIS